MQINGAQQVPGGGFEPPLEDPKSPKFTAPDSNSNELAFVNPLTICDPYRFYRDTSGDKDVAAALERFAEFCGEIRGRLWAGYHPAYCMAETLAGKQCSNQANHIVLFWHLVGFCYLHEAGPIAAYNDLVEAMRAAEKRREQERAAELAPPSVEPDREYGVYIILNRTAGRAKIGMSGRRKQRMTSLRAQCPGETLELLQWIPVSDRDDALDLEREIHDRVSHLRIGNGEWFRASDVDEFLAAAVSPVFAS